MKRFLLWSFERGSIQYDVICGLILAFIFLTPSALFNDRPDFMRVHAADSAVRRTLDDTGNTVYTVKLETVAFSSNTANRQAAVGALEKELGMHVQVSRMQPVYDTIGTLVAYAIWIER